MKTPGASSKSRLTEIGLSLLSSDLSRPSRPWKSGILRAAAAHSLAVVFPDTSPRGAQVEGEETDWDFGTGAGFYLDATADKYKKHYRMRSLVVEELPAVLKEAELPIVSLALGTFNLTLSYRSRAVELILP